MTYPYMHLGESPLWSSRRGTNCGTLFPFPVPVIEFDQYSAPSGKAENPLTRRLLSENLARATVILRSIYKIWGATFAGFPNSEEEANVWNGGKVAHFFKMFSGVNDVRMTESEAARGDDYTDESVRPIRPLPCRRVYALQKRGHKRTQQGPTAGPILPFVSSRYVGFTGSFDPLARTLHRGFGPAFSPYRQSVRPLALPSAIKLHLYWMTPLRATLPLRSIMHCYNFYSTIVKPPPWQPSFTPA